MLNTQLKEDNANGVNAIAEIKLKKRPQKYTLSRVKKPVSKQIADLEWQIKFSKMKLNFWRDLENGQWKHLNNLHERAKANLKQLKPA